MSVGRGASLAMLFLVTACSPSDDRPPQIEVAQGWTRPTVGPQANAAVYMTIVNAGGSDQLVGAASAAAELATLHETRTENGVSRMRPMPQGIAIAAGETVRLEPRGAHVMLTGLKAPLRTGDKIGLDLQFERTGRRSIEATVLDATADEPAHAMH